jgi:N-acetylglucosaminyl-diphospho-decaprenol L-rhamnosyltransferase
VRVAAVVVSHGQARDVERCLAALVPQVDEVVVVANVPGSVGALPDGVRLLENDRRRGFAANVNSGVRETTAELVCSVNPDAVPRPGAVSVLRTFVESHVRCGVAGPQMVYPDGSWQPSRRRFPTVSGTLVRRTPLRRILRPSRAHYMLDERPTEPAPADWMLAGFLLMRRSMLDELGGFDEGFRLYGEEIDLCYRAAKAGWERWYVPAAVVEHAHQAVTDRAFLTRRTLWHWRGILRFVRKHPERLRAL